MAELISFTGKEKLRLAFIEPLNQVYPWAPPGLKTYGGRIINCFGKVMQI